MSDEREGIKSPLFLLPFLIVAREYRQANLIFHGQNTGDEHGYSTYHLAAVRLHAGKPAKPIHRTAHYARHRINLLTEYERYLIDKYIAYHTACRSGDAAHDNGHPERIAQRQALAHAHHRKQCQTDGVEYKECIVQMDKVLSEEDNPQQCQSGTYQINGVGHPAGSHIEQQVAKPTT